MITYKPQNDVVIKQPPHNDAGERWCWSCRRYRSRDDFNVWVRVSDGLDMTCRSCSVTKTRKHTMKHGNYSNHCWAARKIGSQPLPRADYVRLINSPCAFGGGMRADGVHIGIDRKDSDRGYSPDNVQACCPRHNSLKRDLDDAALRLHLRRHPNHRKCGNMYDLAKKWQQTALPLTEDKPVPLPLFDQIDGRIA